MQATLFDAAIEPRVGSFVAGARQPLGAGAWVEVHRDWLAGSQALFDDLSAGVPWRADRRQMYDREVDVPRLQRHYGQFDDWPHPVLDQARDALSDHFGPELGEPFATVGLCLYRDGRDSVAWHGDRIGRSRTTDTMVAIVSLGAPRKLCFRRRGGGPTLLSLSLGHGDLAVMGGSCQRTFDHCVPKTSRAVGPRISIQFRPRGVL